MSVYNGPFVSEADFLKLTKFPVLVVYGDNIPDEIDPANATGHGVNLDNRRIARDRAEIFVETINERGGSATFVSLPAIGVFGNTHYPMSDTNVDAVAAQLTAWLKQAGLDN